MLKTRPLPDCHDRAASNPPPSQLKQTPLAGVVGSWLALIFLVPECGLVLLLARGVHGSTLPFAHRSALLLCAKPWAYIAIVLFAGRWLGVHIFGAGIAMHLNGSLVGATRVQSPHEIYLWSAYNFTLRALVPYMFFGMRGYSREQLNLRSANWKNDTFVILVVLAIGCLMDLTGPNILQLTPHQRIVGGLLFFGVHLLLTDLPVMIAIYAILLPRYAQLVLPATAFLLCAASQPLGVDGQTAIKSVRGAPIRIEGAGTFGFTSRPRGWLKACRPQQRSLRSWREG